MSDREKKSPQKSCTGKIKKAQRKKEEKTKPNFGIFTLASSENDINAANIMMDEVMCNEPNIGQAGTNREESGKKE